MRRAVIAEDLPVTGAPGPSAAIAALTLSGLPTDRFLFAGFSPSAAGARRTFLEELAGVPATLVLFESPRRVRATLTEMRDVMGDRQAALCRELTKRFEEVRRGSLTELAESVAEKDPKGEVVLVIDRDRAEPDAADLDTMLREALDAMSVKDAVAAVASALNLPRRQVYQAALALEKAKPA